MSNIPVLCYHRVCPVGERGVDSPSLCVSPQQFYRQMRLLQGLGYRTITSQDLVAYSEARKNLPKKSVLLTFDDGYEDNYTYAFPILKRFSFKATIFLVTDHIGKKNVWDSGSVPMLKKEQIEEMHFRGIIFGSHTQTHLDLSRGNLEQLKAELQNSKKYLEELTRRLDTSFCYPYARLNPLAKSLVKESGYLCAFAGDGAADSVNGELDLFEIKRIQVFPSTSLFGFWKKIQPWYPRWLKIQQRLKK